MGCKQSKMAAGAVAKGGDNSGPLTVSPPSIKKTASKDSVTTSLRSTRSTDRVYRLLVLLPGESLDEKAVLQAMTPEAAAYRNPDNRSSPLHVAVKLLDSSQAVTKDSLLTVLSELIRAHPDAVHSPDANGNIPLHYAIAPSTTSSTGSNDAATWKLRTAVCQLLLASDPTGCSNAYLSRNDVDFVNMPGCSPLYRVVQTVPDDSTAQNAPSLEYLNLILNALVASGSSKGTPQICVGNASDGDKPLALLYRRFTRQFDLAEKFFAGDNSRREVVEHRRNYKTAAGNTWKMIELLLKHQEQALAGKTVFRTVHRAVQGETPPDLLRYIVETNAEDLTVADELGYLPLHYAAMSRPPVSVDKKTSFPAFYSKYVMDELLYKYPEAAGKPDASGNFPLTLAVQSGKQWIGGGIKSLYDAYPEALQQINLQEHPALKRALSMDYAVAEEDDLVKEEKAMDIIRDEQHDAIMLVQQENADISEVVTSMWAHEEDAGVQMLGCVAISRLLRQTSDVMKTALTAVPAVVNAMKAHPNEVIVQEKACHALKAMAAADGQREVSFVASGAVAAIIGAMQAHVSDPGVQEEACGAVGCIVHYGGADRATVVASVSGVTAIVNAIAAHPTSRGVQRDGCRALRELTEYPHANLPDLPRSQIENLLVAAEQKFPDDCTEAVDVIMSRLSS